jgi:ABC-type phosphate/phosphonate transport system ATPase subunit
METLDENTITNVIFKHPFTCMIAGPSKSGKTTLLRKILQSNQNLIHPQVERIVYCYSRWQDGFEKLQLTVPAIEFHQGLPDIEEFNS